MRYVWVMLMVAGCSADEADDADVARRPCEQLREHLIDLRLGKAHGDPKVIEAHRAAMEQALGDNFVASCQQQMTTSHGGPPSLAAHREFRPSSKEQSTSRCLTCPHQAYS